jgi:hypothetical protein
MPLGRAGETAGHPQSRMGREPQGRTGPKLATQGVKQML